MANQAKVLLTALLTKTLKKMHQERHAVLTHVRLLETTNLLALRKTGVLTQVRGDILEYRVNTKDHWIRILAAALGSGSLILLTGVLKKRNDLDNSDIDQAEMNLRIYRQQISARPRP